MTGDFTTLAGTCLRFTVVGYRLNKHNVVTYKRLKGSILTDCSLCLETVRMPTCWAQISVNASSINVFHCGYVERIRAKLLTLKVTGGRRQPQQNHSFKIEYICSFFPLSNILHLTEMGDYWEGNWENHRLQLKWKVQCAHFLKEAKETVQRHPLRNGSSR